MIVPVGAKGGFVVKRGKWGGEVRGRLRDLHPRLLLELTDNRIDRGEVVPPEHVRAARR